MAQLALLQRPFAPHGCALLGAEEEAGAARSCALLPCEGGEGEQELYVSGRTVLWSAGGVLRLRCSAEAEGAAALLCAFGDGLQRLCLLTPGLLATHSPTGESHALPLPPGLALGWATPLGLLLSRPGGGPPSALLHPLDACSEVEWPAAAEGAELVWASAEAPLAFARSPAGAAVLLALRRAPPAPGAPRGVQPPRLRADLLWAGEAGADCGCCAAHDADGAPLLCLVSAGAARLLRLQADADGRYTGAAQLALLPALAAAPLAASRRGSPSRNAPLDLLLLRPDGRLELYGGAQRLCAVAPPPPPPTLAATPARPSPRPADSGSDCEMDLGTPEAGPEAGERAPARGAEAVTPARGAAAAEAAEAAAVVGFARPVGGRLNLRLSDGTETRVELPLAPLGPLAAALLGAARAGLPPAEAHRVTEAYYTHPAAAGHCPAAADAALAGLLLEWAGVTSGPPEAGGWGLGGVGAARARALPPALRPAAAAARAAAEPPLPAASAARAGALLHCVWALVEDCQLDSARQPLLPPLAALGLRLASALRWPHWAEALGRAAGALPPPIPASDQGGHPPSLIRAIESLFASGDARAALEPSLLPPLIAQRAACVSWSAALLPLLAGLADGPRAWADLPAAAAAARLRPAELARLPLGISLPLLDALACARAAPPPPGPGGRDAWPPEAAALAGRLDLALPPPAAAAGGEGGEGREEAEDGMEGLPAFSGPLRWPRDARLAEARALLQSARPALLACGEGAELEASSAQPRLWALAQRTAALAVGRGAAALGTARPLPTQPLAVPRLVLSGALSSPGGAVVALQPSFDGRAASADGPALPKHSAGPVELMWPEFHNGCAAGLRLFGINEAGGARGVPASDPAGDAATSLAQLSRTWLLYSRSLLAAPAGGPEPAAAAAAPAGAAAAAPGANSAAGALLALGLAGQLARLGGAEQYRALEGEHAPTAVGLLLGLAASRAGSGHAPTRRTLLLHLPQRHPGSFPELELPLCVQSAALYGLGLLHRGTASRPVVELVLAELSEAGGCGGAGGGAPPPQQEGREGHCLAAGLALGSVLLARGGGLAHLSDLRLEQRLGELMLGGRGGGRAAPQPHAQPAGLLLDSRGWDHLDCTGPGAALALGLMHLGSGCARVASLFALPESHFAVERLRPELLLTRVLARALVLWPSVRPEAGWVVEQLPAVLRPHAPLGVAGGASSARPRPPPRPADADSLACAAVQCTAGALLALGLRFAGSGCPVASDTLIAHAEALLAAKARAGVAGAAGADKQTLETCLLCSALALGAVQSGRGCLRSLRLLRRLRARLDPGHAGSVTYGSHMAVSLAIGWLFLGGGSRAFARSPEATAALLAAMLPPFPAHLADQRGHLQALRHMHALAARARLLQPVDAETGRVTLAPVSFDGAPMAMAPAIAPEAAATLRVLGGRHWPLALGGERLAAALRAGTLVVQRRPGALSYEEDPGGTRALHARGATLGLGGPPEAAEEEEAQAEAAGAREELARAAAAAGLAAAPAARAAAAASLRLVRAYARGALRRGWEAQPPLLSEEEVEAAWAGAAASAEAAAAPHLRAWLGGGGGGGEVAAYLALTDAAPLAGLGLLEALREAAAGRPSPQLLMRLLAEGGL